MRLAESRLVVAAVRSPAARSRPGLVRGTEHRL